MGTSVLYTSTDAIRAVVGVTVKEVPDAMITDQQLEMQLKTALYGWLPTYSTVYSEGTSGTATAEQEYMKDLLVSYCMFFGGVRIVEMILALRESVGDGKSEVTRFDLNFGELLSTLKGRLEDAQTALRGVLTPASSSTPYFGSAAPDYDPVSNT